MSYNYDLIVVGGGPGGYVAAIYAAQQGQKVCLVEKDALGGTCLNRGCIPTKTMIKSVKVLETVLSAASYGVLGIDPPRCKLDLPQVQDRKQKIVKELSGGVAYLLKANGVEVFSGSASFIDEHTLSVGESSISAAGIIIATGSNPAAPPIPISKTSVINSNEALELQQVPERVVIIGGGVIGIEFSYILGSLGAEVTVLEMLEDVLPNVDREIAALAKGSLQEKGIALHTGARVEKIEAGQVVWRQQDKQNSTAADLVLMATGRKAAVENLNLEKAGIKAGLRGIEVNESLQTNVKHIYAVGDVNGKYMLAHVASMEGITAVKHILGRGAKMNYNRVPSCIYLHPEVAAIGLTEEEARRQGYAVKVGRFNYAGNGKALVEGEKKGVVKVITDERLGEILGVHIIGGNATEMISEISLAMTLESTAAEVTDAIHPHPTLSEVIPEAFHALSGRAIHGV